MCARLLAFRRLRPLSTCLCAVDFGYAELRGNFGVRATDRDQAGRFDFAAGHAGGRQRVFGRLAEGPDTNEQTFADQAKIGALRRVWLIAAADHGDEPEALAAARDGDRQAPAPAVFRRSAQGLAVQAREAPVAQDIAERKRLAIDFLSALTIGSRSMKPDFT